MDYGEEVADEERLRSFIAANSLPSLLTYGPTTQVRRACVRAVGVPSSAC